MVQSSLCRNLKLVTYRIIGCPSALKAGQRPCKATLETMVALKKSTFKKEKFSGHSSWVGHIVKYGVECMTRFAISFMARSWLFIYRQVWYKLFIIIIFRKTNIIAITMWLGMFDSLQFEKNGYVHYISNNFDNCIIAIHSTTLKTHIFETSLNNSPDFTHLKYLDIDSDCYHWNFSQRKCYFLYNNNIQNKVCDAFYVLQVL